MSKSCRNNLVGQKFERWTVLKFIPNDKPHSYWLCECSCEKKTQSVVSGNHLKAGNSKSCGCIKNEQTSKLNTNDLTGQIFGKLKVLSKTSIRKDGHVVWKCQCSCGNNKPVEVIGSHLTSGNTKSCGCIRIEKLIERNSNRSNNLIGQIFGKLKVLSKTDVRENGHVVWKCQCSCENATICYKNGNFLINGDIKSCGCIKSIGEYQISKILNESNIEFKQEYSFEDLLSKKGKKLKFDFGVTDNNKLLYLIEFDGEQHFEFNNKYWNTEEHFKELRFNDILKNNYCICNNIPLIRIPYTQRDLVTLMILQPHNSNFLLKKEMTMDDFLNIGK